jgi:glycine/D-amino acid oxidase-like deaminating enzyme
MKQRRIGIVGGGAAGIFAAITCAEAGAAHEILVFEKGPQSLAKVKISVGGRCNVTHACFDAREFVPLWLAGDLRVARRLPMIRRRVWFKRPQHRCTNAGVAGQSCGQRWLWIGGGGRERPGQS